MSYTPFAHADSLRIGTVDFVSPSEVKALLDIEAPDSVALNAGGVRPFPRVNGFVLVPVDDGYLVGQIEWMTIERSAFPKRRGMQDFGLIDLPYPLRKMSLNPLGTLRKEAGMEEGYLFQRGAEALPSVGSPVLLPTEKQLRSIVESAEHRRVRIGTSPLAANAAVSIDPDRLFGRHLAVLGNTGSGKSCSVAGLIRWSLEAARSKRQDEGNPNARFIVLDPNGEYTRAFSGTGTDVKARIFKVNPEDGVHPLKVPLWFWNSAEWSSFTQASAKTQRPLLRRALREVKAISIIGRFGVKEPTEEEQKLTLRRYLSSLERLGGIIYQQGPDEDVPLPFRGADLADHLQILAEQENVTQFLDFLVSRIRTFLSDSKINSVVANGDHVKLDKWLTEYIGGNDEDEGQLVILDLSLVPSEVVHVVTAVTARMIFEALQRYKKLTKVVLPTTLVVEEAHTFIKRYKDDVENQDAASVCCQVFERIAREGRKFGLGLVLSSQRPSELSPTVLSQCNTFLMHRISNDRDQELVHRLVPDNLRGLLRELPSLPSQYAILLGWASELPLLVKINELPKSQQPHSDDPDYWDVWTGSDKEGSPVERKVSWKPVADDWQNIADRQAEEN